MGLLISEMRSENKMAENSDIAYKLDVMIQLSKTNIKLSRCIFESLNNISIKGSEKFKEI